MCLVVVGVVAFCLACTRSIWHSRLPGLVFVKPGVVFDPGNPTGSHWGFIVVLRGDEPAYRANLTFQDMDKADEIGRRLKT